MKKSLTGLAVAAAVAALPLATQAAALQVKVTVENLVAANGISFAPLHVAFHGGTFDAFNLGEVAGAGIRTVAESGDGSVWFSELAAADATATAGTVLPVPLTSGTTGTATFTVDTDLNPFFSFAAMALPSNDFFIGNDHAMAYRLFDAGGALTIGTIEQRATDLWDAGSEVFDPDTAVFVAGADGGLHADQHSVVARNFAELAAFNGLTTGAGTVLDSQLRADSPIYRISFEVQPVPVPAALPLMLGGLGVMGAMMRRRTA